MGEYRIYRGVGGVDSIDWTTPVGTVPAGTGTKALAGLGHVADQVYYYGLRAVSDSGVEEDGTGQIVRVVVDDAGNLIGSPPNAITSASAEAVAAGKVRLYAYYKAFGSEAIATGVQVALVTAGAPDWDTPLQTITISRSTRINVVLDETFTDGQTVRLAVRAVTAAGVGGKVRHLNPVVADSSAPEAVEYAEASQV